MKFTVYTKPVGQMRARSCVRGKHAATYKAPAQEQREQSLAALLAQHAPAEPLAGPLTLYVNCHFAIPASKPKKWRQDALCGYIRPTGKPDCSNILKHIEDVMEQVGFFVNDSQIVDARCVKLYGDINKIDIYIAKEGTGNGL